MDSQLQDIVLICNRNDMIVVKGDLNVEVGSNNISREEVIGKFGVMNNKGKSYVIFVV